MNIGAIEPSRLRAAMAAPAAKPRILLFAVQINNTGSCRLPKALKAAGFDVGVVATAGSYLHCSQHTDRAFAFLPRRFAPGILRALERARRDFRPDVIVPGDERAAALIRYWVAKERDRRPQLTASLRDCLRRSLGSLETLDQRSFKPETLRVAKSLGIRVPREVVVTSVEEALAAAETWGYPVVVKAAHGVGGVVTRRCDEPDVLREHFIRLHGRLTSRTKIVRRRLLGRDWFPGTSAIGIQSFISGQPAMTCAAALAGRTLSVVTGFTEQVSYEMGPSSVVRLAEHAGMASTTAAMIAALGASGFISFDFVVDEQGVEHLLECNPRPIQIFHLGPIVGTDLAGSLRQALQGEIPAAADSVNGRTATVALFPQEWRREPTGIVQNGVHHDVPWDDPPLLQALINGRMRYWRSRSDDEAQP